MSTEQTAPQVDTDARRFDADGVEQPIAEVVDLNTPVIADFPGFKPENGRMLTLSNPLNERDRIHLGLPKDASTEVGQKVLVNRNGANTLINAGYATVDPENESAVAAALKVADQTTAESPTAAEPTAPADLNSTPSAEAPAVAPPPSAPQTLAPQDEKAETTDDKADVDSTPAKKVR